MKKILALILSLAMLFALAACGSANEPAAEAPAEQEAAAPEEKPAEEPAAESAGGDTLNLVLSTSDGSTTDDKVPTPWYNRNMATNLMFRSLFLANSSLTSAAPDLADYSISDDGLVYTITVKDGLKWSDGEPLTADDVVFSIETAKQAATVNAIYTTAFSKISDMKVEGNVLTMTLTEPYAAMINVLAQFAILPQHSLKDADPLAIDSDPFWKNPVTSGMYAMDEFSVGNYFTLKLNENYEGAAPKIQKVTVSFVTDFLTAAQAGSADYLYGNATDLVDGIAKLPDYTSEKIDVLFYKYFIFNMKGVDGKENPAMQDVAVRRAIIEAIDRAALANLYPSAAVLNSGVPNSYTAYNGYEYKFDAEKAKADLTEAGYDFDHTLRICYYNNDQTSIDLISAVAYYLEQTGMKVETTLSNDGTTDLFTTREYDIGFKGKSAFSIDEWYTEYLSTDALFANIFGGTDEFDEAVTALFSATNESDRDAALKTLQELEQEKVYKVPMFTLGNYVFLSNHVSVPENVEFCNPLYSCDIDFANWEMVG
ncbi:MAG: ABC transporter substrate-binding protein [Candidatus Limivicinus sp.]|jgi:peptide/nickel transport system substrate-binding protein